MAEHRQPEAGAGGTIWAASARMALPWRSRAGAAALALIVGQLVWRGILLRRGYFTQDDFLMLTLGGRPLSVDLLTQDYSGHLFPGGFAIAWWHTQLAPLDWEVAVAEIVALQLLASVLAWMVLCRLLPGSWWRLPILAVYLFCPLTLWPTQWWAVAIQFLPVTIFLFVATWALLHGLQEGGRWSAPVVVGATAAGLLFQERAVLYPIVLAFVAIAYADAVGWRRIGAALRAHRGLWLTLVVLLVGYVALHRELAPIERTSPGSAAATAELVGNFVARNAVPGLVGGPWTHEARGTIVEPAIWAVVTSWVVLLVVVGLTLWRSRSAVWGWLLLLCYTLADVLLLFGGRSGPEFGAVLGLLPRYSADIVPVLMVALGLVARATAEVAAPKPEATRWRRPAVLASALVVVYVASAAVTTAAVAPSSFNEDDRDYVETLRRDLRADPRAVLFDSVPPPGVMVGWFGDRARVSTVVGTAPEAPVFDLATYSLRMADAAGRVRPLDLLETESDVRTADRTCVHKVTAGDATRVRLTGPIRKGKLVARVSYYTAATGFLTVITPGGEEMLPLREGLNTGDVVLQAPVDSLDLRLETAADAPAGVSVCVVGVVVGIPTPRP